MGASVDGGRGAPTVDCRVRDGSACLPRCPHQPRAGGRARAGLHVPRSLGLQLCTSRTPPPAPPKGCRLWEDNAWLPLPERARLPLPRSFQLGRTAFQMCLVRHRDRYADCGSFWSQEEDTCTLEILSTSGVGCGQGPISSWPLLPAQPGFAGRPLVHRVSTRGSRLSPGPPSPTPAGAAAKNRELSPNAAHASPFGPPAVCGCQPTLQKGKPTHRGQEPLGHIITWPSGGPRAGTQVVWLRGACS